MDSFTLGRDAFYDFLRDNHLMLRRYRRRTRTTDSNHLLHKYPNIIRGIVLMAPNQLWVSDITYIPLMERFCFLSLVTDAYSHKIVGWELAPTLAYKHTEDAMRAAIKNAQCDLHGLIHHSDRGFQYAYPSYIALLNDEGIQPSMTENGDPLENAIAERANGILKQEWLNDYQFKSIDEVRTLLEWVIPYYNSQRAHSSIDWHTPDEASQMKGQLKRRWKNYYRKKVDPIKSNEYVAAPLKTDIKTNQFSMCQPVLGIKSNSVNPI
jgi:putative transposase